MGFVVRSIFWLGLVYAAIPLDFGSLVADRAPHFADGNPLAACAHWLTDDCRRLVGDLRKPLGVAGRLGMPGGGADAAEATVASDRTPPRKPRQDWND